MNKLLNKLITILIIIICILTSYLGLTKKELKIKDNKDNNVQIEEQINKKELFEDYYDKAEKILNNMTLEEKVSQMFVVAYRTSNDRLYKNVGGYIFYTHNVAYYPKETIIDRINSIQEKAKIKHAIVIDEEGGTVSRIGKNMYLMDEPYKSPRDLYNRGGLDLILNTEVEKDTLLKELGFNLNLAPVADMSNEKNSFIYHRSIGLDKTKTSNYIKEVTKKAKELKFSTCLKHFPGLGENKDDSHYESVIDKRSLDYLKENDFLPFKAGIEAGTPFIMVSHNILESVDSKYPTSLSKKVINILTEDLNYSGLIITDDIAMDSLYSFNKNNEASILAVNAGNTMIMTSSYEKHYNQVLNAVKSKKITEEQINSSVKKILAWKLAYNIIS